VLKKKDILIRKFNPEEWNKKKQDIIALEEKCFVEELIMTEKEIEESLCDEGAICYLAFDNGVLIGNTYGNILQSTDTDWFDGHWNPETYEHYDEKTMYVTSTAVLPEYRGKGVATKLKQFMFKDLKENGFKYVVGHSDSGAMTHINEKFGAKIIGEFKNWYDSSETHYLYEVKI